MVNWQVKFKSMTPDGEVYSLEEGWEPFGATSAGIWLKRVKPPEPARMINLAKRMTLGNDPYAA